jgi:hypothetical protein
MGPTKSDYNRQLITLAVITLSGFHCISYCTHKRIDERNEQKKETSTRTHALTSERKKESGEKWNVRARGEGVI